jgi:hypothetical protein
VVSLFHSRFVKVENGEKGYIPASYVQKKDDLVESDDVESQEDQGQDQRDREADIDSDPIEGESGSSEQENSEKGSESEGSDGSSNETENSTSSGEEDSQSESESDHSHNSDDQVQTLLLDLQKRKSRSRRKHLPAPQNIDSTLPQGFRHSTLYECVRAGVSSANEYLNPELHAHGLSFKDLHYDPKNIVRKRSVKCSVAFSVQAGKFIPHPGDLAVVGRQVRISLFDRSHILSNVHSVPAQVTDDDGTWSFQTQKVVIVD